MSVLASAADFAANSYGGLLLWVKTGSPAWASECPVLGGKRKSNSGGWRSAFSQEPTFERSAITIKFRLCQRYYRVGGRNISSAASPALAEMALTVFYQVLRTRVTTLHPMP